jgi:CHAD domain-containing protein
MARAREIRGLACDEPFRTAAGKILWTRFEELISFRDQVLDSKDAAAAEESVHDMRVASRRLRAALEVFVDVFPKRSFRLMLKTVKALADALGEVRDIDVMVGRLKSSRKGKSPAQRQALDGIIAGLEARRQGARDQLEKTLDELDRKDFPRRFAVFVAQETV